MTGFGSAENTQFRVEMRSLNHRYLEMAVRLPSALYSHEMNLRNTLKERFGRGKVDAFVNVVGGGKVSMELNHDSARLIHASLYALCKELGLEEGVQLRDLLQWRDSIISEQVTYDEGPLYDAFNAAVESMLRMRLEEGAQLEATLRDHIDKLESLNEQIASLAPEVREENRKRHLEVLNELLKQDGGEDSRMLQAITAIVEKADITEEINRLRSHFQQVRGVLDEGGACGRKLDFLMQELIRETNTIASKSGDNRVLGSAIEMKSEIERAREQVQNIQ